MQSSTPSTVEQPTPTPQSAPTLTDGVAAWSALCDRLAQRAALDAQIVELTGAVQRSGTIEAVEGVALDTALNLVHRLPASERGMMLTAADVLADMPATMRLLHDRVLSWGQVRGIVAEAKRLSRHDRAVLDAHIDASADMFAKVDPDDAVDAVRIVATELRGIRQAERAEERVERSNFVWGQPGMFDSGKLYGELDNLSLARVLARIDALAPGDDGRSLSQRRADGLVAIARHTCPATCLTCDTDTHSDTDTGPDEAADGDDRGAGGDSGGGGGDDGTRVPPRRRTTLHPRLGRSHDGVVVCVDLRDATVTSAGTILLDAPGCLPTITAKAAEALA
ncbi:MAG TPA: DUF222 domain-containing protein, partial [Mycobacterium sp.]|nr:DUF222 domain-containing protein [Mycobacterium sp.]